MKDYTAIYHTESLKGIQYSFSAENIEAAVRFCENKFSSFPNIAIIENDDNSSSNSGRVVWYDGSYIL